ncbi:hypothetical protein ACLOJK_014537, partial [Asimina triloba]
TDSEATYSDPPPSPSPPPPPHPEPPLSLPPQPTPPPTRRMKQMAIRPKRTLFRKSPESPQDPPAAGTTHDRPQTTYSRK